MNAHVSLTYHFATLETLKEQFEPKPALQVDLPWNTWDMPIEPTPAPREQGLWWMTDEHLIKMNNPRWHKRRYLREDEKRIKVGKEYFVVPKDRDETLCLYEDVECNGKRWEYRGGVSRLSKTRSNVHLAPFCPFHCQVTNHHLALKHKNQLLEKLLQDSLHQINSLTETLADVTASEPSLESFLTADACWTLQTDDETE